MRVGLILPQGWTGEYAGWEPERAWHRTVELAQRADSLGFDSLWLYDHFHTVPDPTDEMTFESFTALAALAPLTRRTRLGQVVICAGFRNPALVAKMASMLDVVSGGRFELGIGAGWKEEEWLAYGYEFPPLRDRLSHLDDSLAVIAAMFEPGRATVDRPTARVEDAINLPKPLQRPRIPIMVGGNGPEVTWRIAARYADELNLDGTSPEEARRSLSIIWRRCEEIGRDPATLRVSVHIWWEDLDAAPSRPELLRAYAGAGVSRVMAMVRRSVDDPGELDSFADDVRAAGAELE